MDRWLSGQEQACSVVSQHPMMAYCKSNFEGSIIPIFLSGHSNHIIYRHTCRQKAHTHNFFIKKLNTFIGGEAGESSCLSYQGSSFVSKHSLGSLIVCNSSFRVSNNDVSVFMVASMHMVHKNIGRQNTYIHKTNLEKIFKSLTKPWNPETLIQ